MDLFYNAARDKTVTHGNLPHWSQQGKLHFVTFRMADSLPSERLEQLRHERRLWQAANQPPYTDEQRKAYYRLFSERVETWLDNGHGECLLAQPDFSVITANALRHFQGQRYELDHWVIMPNHIHVLVRPLRHYTLKDILHGWKSFTAHEFVRKKLHRGRFWQHESFDHIVRNMHQLDRFRQYLLENYQQGKPNAVLSQQTIT